VSPVSPTFRAPIYDYLYISVVLQVPVVPALGLMDQVEMSGKGGMSKMCIYYLPCLSPSIKL